MIKLPLMFSLATLCGAFIANFTYASDAEPLLNSLYDNAQGSVPSLAPIIDKVTPSVVTINVEGSTVVENNFPNNFDFFFGGDPFGFNPFSQGGNSKKAEKQFRALGSGVIIDAGKGYIVTNNHVVRDAKKINITTQDGRVFEAKKIGADPQSDFALLQIEAKNLVAVKFADSDRLRVGDFAIAIGNPFGLGQTVTYGIISALGRSVDGNTDQFENYIQTDAAINQGNSGGSLVDLHGNLIGINTAIIAPNGGNVGIGFAIPSNMIKSLTEQIIKYGEVRRGFLGIMGGELTHDLAEKFMGRAQVDGQYAPLEDNGKLASDEIDDLRYDLKDSIDAYVSELRRDMQNRIDNSKKLRYQQTIQFYDSREKNYERNISHQEFLKEMAIEQDDDAALRNAEGALRLMRANLRDLQQRREADLERINRDVQLKVTDEIKSLNLVHVV